MGVKADLRAYEHPVLLSGSAPWDTLIEAASAVTKEIPGINRCIWNLAPDAPSFAVSAGGHRHPGTPGPPREADHIVMEALRRHDLYDDIWQCPTVLVPLQLGGSVGEMIVLRPVISERAMTARPYPLPDPVLDDLRGGDSEPARGVGPGPGHHVQAAGHHRMGMRSEESPVPRRVE